MSGEGDGDGARGGCGRTDRGCTQPSTRTRDAVTSADSIDGWREGGKKVTGREDIRRLLGRQLGSLGKEKKRRMESDEADKEGKKKDATCEYRPRSTEGGCTY